MADRCTECDELLEIDEPQDRAPRRVQARTAGGEAASDPRGRRRVSRPIETQCVYCGVTLTATTLTMDHVIPLSRGGSNLPANKAPACKDCNGDKAQLTAAEYLSLRHDRERLEARKRMFHDEMSARGRELRRPLPATPPVPPPNGRIKCVRDLGHACHCPVCDPQAHDSLTRNLRRREIGTLEQWEQTLREEEKT